MNLHPLDQFTLLELFLGSGLLMLLFLESGYRVGSRATGKAVKLQAAQVRAIMGAALGLAAFLLAFTFAVSQAHYETRTGNMIEETRIARNAFLQAEFLPEPQRSEARQLLRSYVADRVQMRKWLEEDQFEEVWALIRKSESIQRELWLIVSDRPSPGDSLPSEYVPFRDLVISLIDVHAMRIQASLMNRISWAVWVLLYAVAAMAMLITGYQAGLTGRRSPVATFTLAVAFAAVLMLIIDLDRPVMSLFRINDQVTVDLLKQMDEFPGADLPPSALE